VDEAFRQAATQLQGRPLIGVIDSIGQRRDARAVELLQGLLTHADDAVVSAAAGALGRIGNRQAAAILQGALAKDSPVKTWIADACLNCAEGLAAAGQTDDALKLYDAVGQAPLPPHLQIAALAGKFHVLQAEAKDLLLEQLRTEDADRFAIGLSFARRLPGAELTALLAGELEKLPPARQGLLLRALGDRQDRVPLATVVALSRSQHAPVREAAIAVLAAIGDASATAVLLEAALGGGPTAQVALEGLKTLPGQQVDEAILAKLAAADAKTKLVLLELAGARRIAAAQAVVRAALTDADEAVRLAALPALAQLIALEDFELLTSRALAAESKESTAARDALRTAALRMADRDACAARLGACLAGASAADQEFLLDLLGKVSGVKALEIVALNAKSNDAALKDAATKVLGDWPNPDAADALLDIAKTDAENKYRVRALRGYIRIARQLKLPDAKKIAMFQTVMETAARDDEKKLALDILTRIPSARSLNLAVTYLQEPALKDTAADAAVKIAPKLLSTDPKAVAAAMQKVVEAGAGGQPGTLARELLGQAQAALK
jgi:HEAT repeat protein